MLNPVLNDDQRARITVVLVRARNPNNIGAVARAMHNFGFSDLRLVNDYSLTLEKARSAVDASAILKAAREFTNLADCVADCGLVVGTTAVGERRQQHALRTPAEGSGWVCAAAAVTRVALLFGSEKTGLNNEALSHCHWLMTIPMHRTPGLRHASMNLGQAAAICLYELVRNTGIEVGKEAGMEQLGQSQPPASAGDLERVTRLLTEMLDRIGYARRRPAGADPEEVRRMLRRLRLNQSDARRWTGILRQLLWKLGQTPSE